MRRHSDPNDTCALAVRATPRWSAMAPMGARRRRYRDRADAGQVLADELGGTRLGPDAGRARPGSRRRAGRRPDRRPTRRRARRADRAQDRRAGPRRAGHRRGRLRRAGRAQRRPDRPARRPRRRRRGRTRWRTAELVAREPRFRRDARRRRSPAAPSSSSTTAWRRRHDARPRSGGAHGRAAAWWSPFPVGAPDTCAVLAALADAVVCPLQPEKFSAVGAVVRRLLGDDGRRRPPAC